MGVNCPFPACPAAIFLQASCTFNAPHDLSVCTVKNKKIFSKKDVVRELNGFTAGVTPSQHGPWIVLSRVTA